MRGVAEEVNGYAGHQHLDHTPPGPDSLAVGPRRPPPVGPGSRADASAVPVQLVDADEKPLADDGVADDLDAEWAQVEDDRLCILEDHVVHVMLALIPVERDDAEVLRWCVGQLEHLVKDGRRRGAQARDDPNDHHDQENSPLGAHDVSLDGENYGDVSEMKEEIFETNVMFLK